jgi:hypothetical protein
MSCRYPQPVPLDRARGEPVQHLVCNLADEVGGRAVFGVPHGVHHQSAEAM